MTTPTRSRLRNRQCQCRLARHLSRRFRRRTLRRCRSCSARRQTGLCCFRCAPPHRAAPRPHHATRTYFLCVSPISSLRANITLRPRASEQSMPAPHASRCFVASRLHARCAAAALPLVEAFRCDSMLPHSLCVARALIDACEGAGAPGAGGRGLAGSEPGVEAEEGARADAEGWAKAVAAAGEERIYGPNASPWAGARAGAGAAAEAGLVDAAFLTVRFEAALPPAPRRSAAVAAAAALASSSLAADGPGSLRAPPQLPPPAPLPPLRLPQACALAAVDEACDQAAFLCRTLETYQRIVSVCLGLGAGSGDQPSATRDALADATHALQVRRLPAPPTPCCLRHRAPPCCAGVHAHRPSLPRLVLCVSTPRAFLLGSPTM